jgi:hypothetical protein
MSSCGRTNGWCLRHWALLHRALLLLLQVGPLGSGRRLRCGAGCGSRDRWHDHGRLSRMSPWRLRRVALSAVIRRPLRPLSKLRGMLLHRTVHVGARRGGEVSSTRGSCSRGSAIWARDCHRPASSSRRPAIVARRLQRGRSGPWRIWRRLLIRRLSRIGMRRLPLMLRRREFLARWLSWGAMLWVGRIVVRERTRRLPVGRRGWRLRLRLLLVMWLGQWGLLRRRGR